MTRREWLVAAEVQLASAGVDAARLEAQVLLAHHLGVTRASLLANLDEPGQADDLLAQRMNGEPLAYITGVREFYGRMFRVGPGALIPRHESETLINEALKLNWRTALDVGTGSGCLALTLAAERPGSDVHGLDVSEEALAWAKRNDAELNPDGERVTWHHADAFRWHPTEPFDLIVSNPPYIAPTEPLPTEIHDYEPHLALYSGDDGLDFYRMLARRAPDWLNPGGCLLVEIGDGRLEGGQEVWNALDWTTRDVVADLDGRPRVWVLSL